MKIPALLLLLAIGFSTLPVSARDPVMGARPGQLLGVLPPPPEGWKLLTSMGTNEISAHPALLTFAIREYRFDPPPLPDGTVPPIQRCRLILLDSAYDPDRSLIYEDFSQPKKAEKKVRKRYSAGGVPVIEQWKSPVSCNLRLAFADRFHLTMLLENLNEREVKQWLEWVRPAVLSEAAHNAPKEKPTPKFFDFYFVNELDPSKNRVSQIAYMTQEEQASEMKRAEQFSKQELEKTQAIHDKASAAAGVPPPGN